ncbi:coiled-coil domain-containing protein 125 isoform X1 [Carcharodon carcharias]|uniref:coiled-coil domain-containing protein 125 isoform X1 n=1 Tax=Carcharodon carcharias TaxID=13397 RepID=UPI001B7DB508|nr:coiled-coil domain-containing protein 125 isoform X1 [Carcharodon carcharias]XP_041042955.1 coiled-coil domain-containing protein 125 isoform X1 [Carcharodon carcharias]XP_041042956.1 coiled-coil domain-containing protein 125 isoform X1 [Carcharodon carcharias]
MSERHGTQMKVQEDDMSSGDLGDGLCRKPGGIYEQKRGSIAETTRSRQGSDADDSIASRSAKEDEKNGIMFSHWTKYGNLYNSFHKRTTSDGTGTSRWSNSSGSQVEMSNEELKLRLQDVVEEAEFLRCELEVTQQQLEGKYEALKILQSMAVLDKATTHTKTLLQKTGERNKILEKEVNLLQWENDLKQDKFKNLEQFWIGRYDRMCIENAELAKTLEARDVEIRDLKSENAVLNQQCSELLAMLDAKDQHTFQRTLPVNKKEFTEVTTLELGVLGACHCNGTGAEPCACARMAAATRKQLLQLKEEFDLQRKREEEAYIMVDAFRIAFEHQLKRTNDQTLRITEVEKLHRKDPKKGLVWKRTKADPFNKTKVIHTTIGQKLKGLFNSSTDCKKLEVLEDPQEVLKILIDLLNDKEEALAHQRKVSYMLARSVEEQERNHLRKDTLTIETSEIDHCQKRWHELKNISCPSIDQNRSEHRTLLRTNSSPAGYFVGS